jgi:hypothetical protein
MLMLDGNIQETINPTTQYLRYNETSNLYLATPDFICFPTIDLHSREGETVLVIQSIIITWFCI